MASNITSTYKLLTDALASQRLHAAIECLRVMARVARAPWAINRDIDNLSESYNLLRKYALDGVEDPDRLEMLSLMKSGIRQIASMILRYAEQADSPKQYFGILRYESMQADSSLSELLMQYDKLNCEYVEQSLIGRKKYDGQASVQAQRNDLETLSRRIFNFIWTLFPMSVDDVRSLESTFANDAIPNRFKELIVSAITLGGLEYFDESRILLLAKLYQQSYPQLEVKALIGMALIMWCHRNVVSGCRLKNAIETISEKTSWASDLKMIFLELARTRDTERISRKFRDEIIPDMMKLRPDLIKKIGNMDTTEDMMSIDENPEWAEMLDKSGLGNKLKELNDIQADGGDVMMSTFAQLKGFSFFNEVANWFMPFSLEHSAVTSVLDDSASDIGELVASSPMICDGDKYSIILSLERIPAPNRRMMLNQFKLQDIHLSELKSSELNPEKLSRQNLANKYIQDLYRFFNLYRRKGDFNNPFSDPINLAGIKLLERHIDDTDALAVVGEFYFKRGYWTEALELFELLRSRGENSPELLQKIGYCFQQTGDLLHALENYSNSELMRPDSLWTLRRIAQCLKMLGRPDDALSYYLRIAEKKPDDLKIAMNIGHCYLETQRYDEALSYYYKVEYMSDDASKAYRPIAWCAFLTGDYQRSLDYYNKVLSDDPSASDYLNMGHLHVALKKYREAVNYYGLSRLNTDGGDDAFVSNFSSDYAYLINAGAKEDLLDIILDTVLE